MLISFQLEANKTARIENVTEALTALSLSHIAHKITYLPAEQTQATNSQHTGCGASSRIMHKI